MSDVNTNVPKKTGPSNWTGVANNALHLAAGLVLLVGAGYLNTKGHVSDDLMAVLISAAATALGWKWNASTK